MKSGLDGRWSWCRYLINRGSRLYIVLIPALLLGLILDHIGMALHSSGIYAGRFRNPVVTFSVAHRSNWSTLVGNALFLQDIFVDPLGSNGALWSLSYEFWYYIVFPFLAFAILSKNQAIRWLSASAAGVILLFVGKTISLYFIIWLTGAAINMFPPYPKSIELFAAIVMAVFFSLTLIASRLPGFLISQPVPRFRVGHTFITDFVLGLATATLIHAIVGKSREIASDSLYHRIATALARFSYTLYLVHLPLLVLINSCIGQVHPWQPTARTVVSGVFIGATALIYSGTVAYFTEHRTDDLRRWLMRLIEPLEVSQTGDQAAR